MLLAEFPRAFAAFRDRIHSHMVGTKYTMYIQV